MPIFNHNNPIYSSSFKIRLNKPYDFFWPIVKCKGKNFIEVIFEAFIDILILKTSLHHIKFYKKSSCKNSQK